MLVPTRCTEQMPIPGLFVRELSYHGRTEELQQYYFLFQYLILTQNNYSTPVFSSL
jgi:hypothetical protein